MKTMKIIGIACALWMMTTGAVQAADVNQSVWSQSYQLEAKGDYEKAAAVISPLRDSQDVGEFVLLRYGWLNYLQGNFNDAIRSYKSALERSPRSFDARLGIALPLMGQQRWREASRYLTQVMDQSPFQYTANIRLLVCQEGLRQWESLEKHAKSMAMYYPTDISAQVYLARAYAWQGKKILAMQAYRQVLMRMPNHLEALKYVNQ